MRKEHSKQPLGEHNSKPIGSGKEIVAQVKAPTLKARWSQSLVAPRSDFRVRTKEAKPQNSKVTMVVETEQIPDNLEVTLEVRHAHTKSVVKDGRLTGLRTRGGKVIDPLTGKLPFFEFRSEQMPWETWDFPYFYFSVELTHLGKKLKAESPRDYRHNRHHLLRVVYWHVVYCDGYADHRDDLGIASHAEEIKNILDRPVKHQALHYVFTEQKQNLRKWGSLLSNAYSYYHVGHGEVINQESVLILGNQPLTAEAIRDKSLTPSVPRYLVYLNSCKVGAEQSLAKAFIDRGTRFVLAFEKEIGVKEATRMAETFYKRWGRYDFNPEKIAVVFLEVSAIFSNLKPKLFGSSNDQPSQSVSTEQSAGRAAQRAAPGALSGPVLLTILKPPNPQRAQGGRS